MSSEIVKLLLTNASKLTPIDYLLVAVISALVIAGAVLLFHWLYRERFTAQNEVITLKDETIAEVRRQMKDVSRDRDRLRQESATQASELENMRLALEQHRQAAAPVLADALLFSNHAQYAIALEQRILLVFRQLAFVDKISRLYAIVSYLGEGGDGPTLQQLDEQLDAVSERLRRAIEPTSVLTDRYMDLQARLDLDQAYAISDTANQIENELSRLGDTMMGRIREAIRARRIE